jgi:hypothetical protein
MMTFVTYWQSGVTLTESMIFASRTNGEHWQWQWSKQNFTILLTISISWLWRWEKTSKRREWPLTCGTWFCLSQWTECGRDSCNGLWNKIMESVLSKPMCVSRIGYLAAKLQWVVQESHIHLFWRKDL